MKSFFKMFFASLLAIVTGMGCLTFFVITAIVGAVAGIANMATSNGNEPLEIKRNTILKINLSSISEIVEENPLDQLFSMGKSDAPVSLTQAMRAIKSAKENPNISGIYLNVEGIAAGMASVDELRRSLEDFKQSGKFIVAYADGFTQKAYYLSTIADLISLNPEGNVGLIGVASGNLMFRGALAKLGVKTEVFKVGTYKSAVEPFILEHMSEANKEQVQTYIDGLWSNILGTISEARGISTDDLRAMADEGIAFAPSATLIERRLVDTLVYRRDVEGLVAQRMGLDDSDDVRMITLSELANQPEKEAKGSDNRIKVIVAEGEIMPAEASSYGGSMTMITYSLVDQLKEAADDDDVKAVVLRINSPGGSAFLSEQIWKEMKALRERKPVVVSMGDVSASGGYYIASAANRIIAEANTLTGSIGIFGMMHNASDLAKQYGVNLDVVKTSKFANMEMGIGMMLNPMTAEERALIQTSVERGYKLFLSHVAEGRGMTMEEADRVGQGRVWLGTKALELGLVDELGGLQTAIASAAKLASLSDYRVDFGQTTSNLFDRMFDSQRSDDFVARLKYTFMSREERALMRILERETASFGVLARLPYELSVY